MLFLDKLKKRFRDHGRDEMCAHLRTLGIEAEMSERGRPEEKIGGSPKFLGIFDQGPRSLGIIEIQDAPIRWVNVRTGRDPDTGTFWDIEYGVPDARITEDFPKVEIRTNHIKGIPLVGKVVDLKWKGKDFDLGLIKRLNHDVSLNEHILDSHGLNFGAYPEHGCWILEVIDVITPSRQEWDSYQAIADHLLSIPIPPHTFASQV